MEEKKMCLDSGEEGERLSNWDHWLGVTGSHPAPTREPGPLGTAEPSLAPMAQKG